MKKLTVIFAIMALSAATAYGQKIAVKNNLLFDATGSVNLGVEYGFSKRFSVELWGSWNPVEIGNLQLRHWLVQPEFRYWTCESFNGMFIGGHLLAASYDVRGLFFLKDKTKRFEGDMYGIGATIGYQWILGRRWNLEASVGAGFIYSPYDRFIPDGVGSWINDKSAPLVAFTPTRATVAIIFFFN